MLYVKLLSENEQKITLNFRFISLLWFGIIFVERFRTIKIQYFWRTKQPVKLNIQLTDLEEVIRPRKDPYKGSKVTFLSGNAHEAFFCSSSVFFFN